MLKYCSIGGSISISMVETLIRKAFDMTLNTPLAMMVLAWI